MKIKKIYLPFLLECSPLPTVSHLLRRCQPLSSSVLPSSMPPPAISVPNRAFAFHLARLLSVTFYFIPPSQQIPVHLLSPTAHSHTFPSLSHRELPQLPRNGQLLFFKLKPTLSHNGRFVICLLSFSAHLSRLKYAVFQAGGKKARL